MDTLKHDQIKELQEHQAISHGGWRLVGGMTAMLLILAMTGIAFYAGLQLNERGARVSPILFALIAVGGFSVVLYLSAHGATWNWLKHYWRRNVRGYVVAHYTEQGRARCSDPFPRGHARPINVFLNSYPFVVLWPLGGWFPRPRAYWRAKQSGWSVARDTRFPGTSVRVTDKNGSSLRFAGIADAMSFIADRLERAATEPFWHENSDMPFNWLQVLEGFSEQRDDARRDRELDRRAHAQSMDALFRALDAATGQAAPPTGGDLTDWSVVQVRRLIAERDAARGEVDRYQDGFLPAAVKDRDAARQEREEAAACIAELDRRFEESSRLHDKLQALRIHERIRNWLYQHRFPTAWETTVANANQQHDADAVALAEVRARIKEQERRDRRRHGKGATAAT